MRVRRVASKAVHALDLRLGKECSIWPVIQVLVDQGEEQEEFNVAQGQRTVAIRLETSIYERWVEFENLVQLKTNCTVAEYLLNVADAFDEQLSR